jgi:probable rRNA maturation factor
LRATIDIISAYEGWGVVCPTAKSLARDAAELALAQGSAASGLAWMGRVELSITLADTAEQRRLNREYRGQDKPTNVLAFPAWDPAAPLPPDAPLLLGDVVLDCETVAREASEQAKPFADHFRHLVVHGVLHLLAYDHRTPAEATEMEALETAILGRLGVPDPYRDTMSFNAPQCAKP